MNVAARSGWLRGGLLLGVLYAAVRLQEGAVHLDLARDLWVGWRFAQGEAVPWHGPLMAGTFHLGPLWYWLLAAVIRLQGELMIALLWVGALSGAQFWLAYLLGKALHSRTAGVLWAVGLVWPSWSSFEWMLPLHYLLTAPLLLAAGVCGWRSWHKPRFKYLFGLALASLLGLHAHPSSVVWWPLLLLPPIGLLLTGRTSLVTLLAAATAALLPLLPYLLWLLRQDFAELAAMAGYLGPAGQIGSLATLPALLQQTAWGGTGYLMDLWLGWSAGGLRGAGGLAVALALAALLGGGVGWQRRSSRAALLTLLALCLSAALLTAMLRQGTTFYMTTPLWVALCGLMAVALASIPWRAAALITQLGYGLVGVGLALSLQLALREFNQRGDWPFSFAPLFDVVGPANPAQPTPFLPLRELASSAAWLCDGPSRALHGAYARHLLYDYGLEMRVACRRSDLHIGGDDDLPHWLGISRSVAERLARAPAAQIGAFALFPVHQVLEGAPHRLPMTPIYPSYQAADGSADVRSYRLRLRPGDHLALSTLAYFVEPAQLRSPPGQPLLQRLAGDAMSDIYHCPGCDPAGSDITVELSGSQFAEYDLVVF